VILRVESGRLFLQDTADDSLTDVLDVAAHTPRWWRKVEETLRFELALALAAKRVEDRCDIVWAGSENIGIPLSYVGLHKPLVVIAHHMSSPKKALLARMTRAVQKWAGIGYISDESRAFFVDYFGVEPDRLFQYEAAKLLAAYTNQGPVCTGPLMSTGVAKRDYVTLLKALVDLPQCDAELYISSRYGDKLAQRTNVHIPANVHIMDWVSDEELIRRYQLARFVVVPLEDTTHHGAGISAVLEASAMGKAVIGTDTGGMRTFVKHGETGLLVPPNDPAALRAAILMLWEQPKLAEAMGQAGHRYMEAHYHPDIVKADIRNRMHALYAERHPVA
jgi:glycosyltransferase involved in cell wall biosynthesis